MTLGSLGGGVTISHNNLSPVNRSYNYKDTTGHFKGSGGFLFQLVCVENATKPETRPCVRGPDEITGAAFDRKNPARRATAEG